MRASLPSTGSLAHATGRVRSAVTRAVFGTALCAWAAGILFGAACLALLGRVAFGWEGTRAAWPLAALVLAPLLAARIASRKRLSDDGAAAWLDVHSGGGGAVVTGFETDDPAWRARVDAALARVERLPAARWKRPLVLCALAFAFAAAALFVPIPRDVAVPSVVLQQAAIESALEKLATLEEEVTLAPEFTSEMRASLERLQENDALAELESTLEAADRAADRLAEEAATAAEAAERALAGLSAAGAEAAADPEAAQKELEAAFGALAKSGLAKGLEAGLDTEFGLDGLALPPGAKQDGATIAKLADRLEARLGEKLAKLAAAGLLKDSRLARAGRPGEMPEFEEHVCTEECAKNPGGT